MCLLYKYYMCWLRIADKCHPLNPKHQITFYVKSYFTSIATSGKIYGVVWSKILNLDI